MSMMTAQNNDEWAEQEIWEAVQGQSSCGSVNVSWHSFISFWFPILNRFVILTELLSHLKWYEDVLWPLSKEWFLLLALYTICQLFIPFSRKYQIQNPFFSLERKFWEHLIRKQTNLNTNYYLTEKKMHQFPYGKYCLLKEIFIDRPQTSFQADFWRNPGLCNTVESFAVVSGEATNNIPHRTALGWWGRYRNCILMHSWTP